MIFSYKSYGLGILRPVISIELERSAHRCRVEGMVDSGADMCIFSRAVAEDLGIEVDAGQRFNLAGVTGDSEPYFVHDVDILIGGLKYSTKIGFTLTNAPFRYGVLGQYGFFSAFVVKFDFQGGAIEVQPRPAA